MIAHITLHSSDYPKAKKFCETVLAALGYKNNLEYDESAGFNDGEHTDLWISKAETVVPTHRAFVAKRQKQVFHKAALAAGAADNGKPGYRDYSDGYHAAFLLDSGRHLNEAVWYDPSMEN